jgi:uncharacterized protein YkwD
MKTPLIRPPGGAVEGITASMALRRLLLCGLAAFALPACREELDVDADEVSGSDGDGMEGPAFVLPNGHPLDWRTSDAQTLADEDQVLSLVNERRVAMGRDALIMQVTHRRVARGHSRHMRQDVHAFFEHENPEGLSPGDRLHACGVDWNHAAENIASGQLSPLQAFTDWVNSPGHREHIDDPSLRRTGVGLQPGAGGADWPTFWTQVFTD